MKLLLTFLIFVVPHISYAQDDRNIIKLNALGIPFNNYSLQYERILNKKSSVAITFRFMPESKLPFRSAIRNAITEEEPGVRATLDEVRLNNIAITPEYRIYLGRGYGRGLYVAPFYRYTNFGVDNFIVRYDSDIPGEEEDVNLSGKFNSHTFGILLGAQWKLGKNIMLDWNIIGPHVGSSRGNIDGISSRTLTPSEQERLREELENFDIPFTRTDISVNSQGASMKLKGPWGGIRTALSIGISF